MRAALYARVSTEDQAKEGFSLDAQIKRLEAYCKVRGWDIADRYVDEGYSGRNTDRPEYNRMMSDMEGWDLILVLKMDRIHRNSRNFMNMMEELDRHGKMFVSSSESLDTTNAMGRFVVDMIQRIAQLESEQIGERTQLGMREKAETLTPEGPGKKTMGFTPPFGYTLENGRLLAVPEEMEVVIDIFSSYSEGETMDAICYSLNRDRRLTRKGNPWNKYNLRNILHNPVYAGYMRWEDLLIRHDADIVLTPREFNAVQERMCSRVRDPAKRNISLIPTEDDFFE